MKLDQCFKSGLSHTYHIVPIRYAKFRLFSFEKACKYFLHLFAKRTLSLICLRLIEEGRKIYDFDSNLHNNVGPADFRAGSQKTRVSGMAA